MSSSSEREFRDWNSRTLTADPQNWWHLLEYERKLAWDAAYAAATEAAAVKAEVHHDQPPGNCKHRGKDNYLHGCGYFNCGLVIAAAIRELREER